MYFTVSTYVFPMQFTFLFQISILSLYLFNVREPQEGTQLSREKRVDGKPLFFQEGFEKRLLAQPLPVEVQHQKTPAWPHSTAGFPELFRYPPGSAVSRDETRVDSDRTQRRDVVFSFHEQNHAFRGGKQFFQRLELLHTKSLFLRFPNCFLAPTALC